MYIVKHSNSILWMIMAGVGNILLGEFQLLGLLYRRHGMVDVGMRTNEGPKGSRNGH